MGTRSSWCFLFFLLTFAPSVFAAASVQAQQAVIFGPAIFTRGTGEPEKIVKNFSVQFPQQKFSISVQNGQGKHGRLTRALLELNGRQIIGPQDFEALDSKSRLRGSNVDLITKSVTLRQQNSITVELRSEPGTSVIVSILGPLPRPVKKTILPPGGTMALDGFGHVTFPEGAFSSPTAVTATVTNSRQVHDDFSVTAEGPRLPYEIILHSGKLPPATSFDVELQVPSSFVATLPQNYQLEIFAQPIELSTTELLGHFHGYPSSFDRATNTVRATLSAFAFNDDAPGHKFRAILIVGAIPKYERKEPSPNHTVANIKRDLWGWNMGDQIRLGWAIDDRAMEYVLFRARSLKGPWVERSRIEALAIKTRAPVDVTPDARLEDLCYKVEAVNARGNVRRRYEPICVPKFIEKRR